MKSTAIAGANIALIKYWGNLDDELRLPMNSSISITLKNLVTTTTVEFNRSLEEDQVEIDGRQPSPEAGARIIKYLDRVRAMADQTTKAQVVSTNNFPAGAGLASSASGFAALTLACASALGQELSDRELSILARLGSGSAARSILGGYVEWRAAERHEDSYAIQIAPPEYWGIYDCIALVSREAKGVSSSQGHRLARTSPMYEARLSRLKGDLSRVKEAIQAKDFGALGLLVEGEALSLHAVMMTSAPSLLYWTPETVRVLKKVRDLREEGLPTYFTLDAGPNVHVLTIPPHVEQVKKGLQGIEGVEEVIVSPPGEGARLVEEHLF